MKKQLISLFCASLLFASCTSELEQITNESFKKEEKGIIRNIKDYIHNFGTNNNPSRNVNDYTLSPYIYNGDTIMYIVNYKNGGWELMSTDYRAPLVLVSSDTGYFDPEDKLQEATAVNAYFSLIEKDLYNLSEMSFDHEQVDNSWKTVKLFENDIDVAKIKTAPKAMGTAPSNNGEWVLIETTSPVVTNIINPKKLTSTDWEQDSPWNNYVPFYTNSNIHAYAGCGPVAAAQYLYYLHYKYGKPATTVTSGTYNSSSNTYSYSGNASIWNQMAKESTDAGTDYAGIFIGYVGQSCNATYGKNPYDGTRVNSNNVCSFINGFGYNYYTAAIDYTYVQNQLLLGKAVLAYAECTLGCGYHMFIIDGYEITEYTTTNIYGWVGKDNMGNDSNEYDEEGNVVSYSYTYETEVTSNSWKLMMNWGYGNYYNSIKYTINNWNSGGHYFNVNRFIYKE